jgi:hypothetical protein
VPTNKDAQTNARVITFSIIGQHDSEIHVVALPKSQQVEAPIHVCDSIGRHVEATELTNLGQAPNLVGGHERTRRDAITRLCFEKSSTCAFSAM